MDSFAIFDENFYLENNPDVAAAVAAGAFSSGLEHFQLVGLQEGRTLVSPFYNERTYLENYPDVAEAVEAGAFSSGLDHYIQFGSAAGRSGIPFDEETYLVLNPDVAAAVEAGAFSSGLEHYEQYGQFENRAGYFSGTIGNDIITGFGNFTNITGIDFEDPVLNENNELQGGSRNLGDGEVDTLSGGAGRDFFQLGFPLDPQETLQAFYVGGGSADYALIQNFDPDADAIRLGGDSLSQYNLQVENGSLNISTPSGDLIGIVDGVTSLPSQFPSTFTGEFYLAFSEPVG